MDERGEPIIYAAPGIFWWGAVGSFVISSALLAFDIQAGYGPSKSGAFVAGVWLAFGSSALSVSFAITNTARVARMHGSRGFIGLITFVVALVAIFIVQFNLYFALGGEH